jgi:hypothetical protein
MSRFFTLSLPLVNGCSFDLNDSRRDAWREHFPSYTSVTKTIYEWHDAAYAPWNTRRLPDLSFVPAPGARFGDPDYDYEVSRDLFAVLHDGVDMLLGRRMTLEEYRATLASTPEGFQWGIRFETRQLVTELLTMADEARLGPLEEHWWGWNAYYQAGTRVIANGGYPSDAMNCIREQMRRRSLGYSLRERIGSHLKTMAGERVRDDWLAFAAVALPDDSEAAARFAFYNQTCKQVRQDRAGMERAGMDEKATGLLLSYIDAHEMTARWSWSQHARSLVRRLPGKCKVVCAFDARVLGRKERPAPATAHIVPTVTIHAKTIRCEAGKPLGRVGPDRALGDDDGRSPIAWSDVARAEKILSFLPRRRRV